MKSVASEEEVTELKEHFIEENVADAHRSFVNSNLGLEWAQVFTYLPISKYYEPKTSS